MAKEAPLFDVIIIGAGLSGIGAAWHLQNDCPNKTYTILEGRASMGGTWDLFRYPGIRSDSDMYTLGFSFNPWKNPKAIADGPAILQYIKDTASKFGIDRHIRFNHLVETAAWNDSDQCWTLTIADQDGVKDKVLRCKFLYSCSGYYDYKQGFLPDFPGFDSFKGKTLHPQFWDENLDYSNKEVVIIGSGATAVTLVPEMAKKAKKVYMLQRTPTYVVTLPSEDKIALSLRKVLPEETAYQIIRWKNIAVSLGFYNAARTWPEPISKILKLGVQRQLGKEYDMKHFDPPYKPWDQRLCVVPDADLFQSIKEGRVEVVTDTIETFTPEGIRLNSGRELKADIIVTATGLKLQLLGGVKGTVNGKVVDSGQAHCYRGVMLSDVPNFAFSVGYTNSSWTLKSELSARFVTKVLKHMDKKGYQVCTPRFDSSALDSRPLLDFDAGYVKRAADVLPKQGNKAPWLVYQNYILDLLSLRNDSAEDQSLEYIR
jgi:cation diffusion facilitator CzcD-associated flavoprotein CzcO